jgi:hypothetical protein
VKVVYCTIACANYLGRVRVLEESLVRHNPGAELRILLCERPEVCNEISGAAGRQFYSPADVGCDNWLHMAFYYNVVEFCTALKPFFIEKLVKEGFGAVIYLDPDIEVFGSLEEAERLAAGYDIVLTPHVCRPLEDDGRRPAMEDHIRTGQFNLGFIAVSGGGESLEALRWWQRVCIDRCIQDESHGRYFVDQFWADIFPSLVEKTCVLRDSGYNVAYWNVLQRDLRFDDGRWSVDGCDLRFFHFSGLATDDLSRVSVYQNRVTAPPGSELHDMLSQYQKNIDAADWAAFSLREYSFSRYSGGELVADGDRKNFLLLDPIERKEIGDPFGRFESIRGIVRISTGARTVAYLGSTPLARLRLLYIKHVRENQLFDEYVHTVRTKGFLVATWYAVRYVFKRGLCGRSG